MGYLVMDSLISVIVPIYNVEKYLRKCIESIINQSYKNLEIILVDDGSTDSCGSICDEYAKIDKRIKVIHKENGGLSDARNRGIEASGGAYLMFIDGDDYINEKMAEILYKRIKEDNTDLAMCNFLFVDECGAEVRERNRVLPIKNEILTSPKLMKKLLGNKRGYYAIACNKLYKKNLFEDIRFPSGKINEDEFVVHRIFVKCQRISCVSIPLYYYVQRSGSIMNAAVSAKNLDIVEALYDRTKYLITHNFPDCGVRTMPIAVGVFLGKYQKIDIKNKKAKLRVKELKHEFNRLYFKYFFYIIKYCSLRQIVCLTCFLFNKDLCNILLQNINKRKQSNNEY